MTNHRDPPLQNIPIRTRLGERIRAAFVENIPPFPSPDYSDLERKVVENTTYCWCERPEVTCPDCKGYREVQTAPFWSDEYDIITCPTCDGHAKVCSGCESDWCDCED